MITTSFARKSFMFAGFFALAALALVFPVDAFATDQLVDQAERVATQISTVPKVIAVAAYAIGAFFIIRALFALKGFIEAPDDNPVTAVIGFAVVGMLMILLPYIIQVAQNSLAADNTAQDSSASSCANAMDTAGF